MSAGGHFETRPVNIYALSRIHEEGPFNIVEKHSSQKSELQHTKIHEIESLRLLVDALIAAGVSISECDGFFYSFDIPQIGKEFDLLKFTDKICLNIELKSTPVPREQILSQLLRNRHYLSHLGKRLALYTVVTNSAACFKLSLNDDLEEVSIGEVASAIRKVKTGFLEHVDNLFRASDYLVSPLNTPSRFIQGEYFLTQAQEQIKKNLLKGIDGTFTGAFFHITGKNGTGKTLLLYDIAKTLSKNGKTVIVHCGRLLSAQVKICAEIENLSIISSSQILNEEDSLEHYMYILVDESQRIFADPFDAICKSVRENDQICIFSSDPEQMLTETEIRNDIVAKINALPPEETFVLSEKIRMNRELQSFIMCLKDLKHRPKVPMDYYNVDISYANSTQEAQFLLEYYRGKGFTFINCTNPEYEPSPFSEYSEDFDTLHVIGQEFDRVVMLLDHSFYYDCEDKLQGIPYPDPNYLYPNLFYQGVTRVRERLALIIVKAPELFEKVVSIIAPEEN
ncbi:MAG: ATP-binding protein [Lachnospiraceae bacterium]|nr:ATP-binding protein [Lachnospiraceae bacterium]